MRLSPRYTITNIQTAIYAENKNTRNRNHSITGIWHVWNEFALGPFFFSDLFCSTGWIPQPRRVWFCCHTIPVWTPSLKFFPPFLVWVGGLKNCSTLIWSTKRCGIKYIIANSNRLIHRTMSSLKFQEIQKRNLNLVTSTPRVWVLQKTQPEKPHLQNGAC